MHQAGTTHNSIKLASVSCTSSLAGAFDAIEPFVLFGKQCSCIE